MLTASPSMAKTASVARPLTDVRNTYFLSNSSAAAGEKDTNAVSGKGVVTEVYLDDDGNLTLVYINTYLMQATADLQREQGYSEC